MTFSIICAIGKNNELGSKNALLWDLPIDMKHFRETTTGHPVIMGQRTFESLGTSPSGKPGRPLPNRRNIVVTLDTDYKADGVEIVYSIPELLDLCKKTGSEDEEFFVIGGGMIYKQMLEYAKKLYITHVDASFPEADTFFPVIESKTWEKSSEDKHEKDDKNIYGCNFTIYKRIGK